MAHEFPEYLKLHIEEEQVERLPSAPSCAALPGLIENFERVTGWVLTETRRAQAPVGSRNETTGPTRCGTLSIEDMSSKLPPGQPAINRVLCDTLVESINQVFDEVNRLREKLWQREAELATAVPVVPHREEEKHLAHRLEQVLRGGAQAVGGTAAALYLLDDATSQLKLRSSWGLPFDRYHEEPRALRGAMADLEALVGHAVVLEDTRLLPHWKAPEDFPAAVCVPVSSATNPLGTLWIFADRPRNFSSHETEMLEIVAGRIVAEIEREAVLAQTTDDRELDRQMALATNWQQERLPNVEPMIDDLAIAGSTSQSGLVGGDFHDWQVLPDGRLATAVGDAQGSAFEASMTAAVVQSSVRSHAMYRQDPADLLAAVNDTMWSGGMGDQFASLFYGVLDPSTWQFEFSTAGNVSAYLVKPESTHRFDTSEEMLGVEPDLMVPRQVIQLEPGDSVIVLTDGMRHALWKSGISEDRGGLEFFLQRHVFGGCASLVNLVKEIANRVQAEGLSFDRSILALQRTPRRV